MSQLPLTTRDEGDGARVLAFPKLDELRALASVVSDATRVPETGTRTPQPSLRRYNSRSKFVDLTLGEVVAILDRAQDGDTEQLADLWLYMLRHDAHLRSVWKTRVAPVHSSRWEVLPAEGDVDEGMAEQAAKACEQALRGVPELDKTLAALLDGIGLGYSVAEIVWRRGTLLGRPAWVPARLVPIHGRRFAFSDDYELGLYDCGQAVPALKALSKDVDVITGRGRQLARLPMGKYVVHQPVEIADYPTSTGLVHALARWWWVKTPAFKSWLSGAESFGNPRWVATVAQAAKGDPVVDDLHEGLERLAADGVMVARGETRVEQLPSAGESAGRAWQGLMDYCDAALSKAVLGSTLNVEIGSTGGNRAAAESQDAVTIEPRQESDATQLWATLRRDVFRWVLAYNPQLFPPTTPLPSGRTVFAEEPVQVDELLVASGWCKVNQLLESRGLPPLGDDLGERFVKPISPVSGLLTPESPTQSPPGVDTAPTQDVQQQALNGAQVTSMVEIVGQVAQGLLPRDTAVEIIVSAFPISREQAEKILGTVGAGFQPAAKVEPDAPSQPDTPEPPTVEEVSTKDDPFSLTHRALTAATRTSSASTHKVRSRR